MDRLAFSRRITDAVESHPRIEVEHRRVTELPSAGRVILATGPLTDSELAEDLARVLGEEYLYFYDAISPIVYADSVDHDVAFRASRYEESGEGDYLNLPLARADYETFVDALLADSSGAIERATKSSSFVRCWRSSVSLVRCSKDAGRKKMSTSTGSSSPRRISSVAGSSVLRRVADRSPRQRSDGHSATCTRSPATTSASTSARPTWNAKLALV